MIKAAFPIRVVIRTDASLQIGTGHVMRCLTLATELLERGAEVQFMCRLHDGHLIDFIKGRGFAVVALPKGASLRAVGTKDMLDHGHWLGCDWQTDVDQCSAAISAPVDWIIVDHYALDHRWETAMRDQSNQIMCIDDLADRQHDCDVLLDQSLGWCHENYRGLVPEHARLFLGPEYALLRPEFVQWRAVSLARRVTPQLRHILISMGGVDAGNVSGRVLRVLQDIEIVTLDRVTVVLGPLAPWWHYVLAEAKKMPVPTRVLSGVDNMAELMTSCDLAIGAGGSTTWERCALGVPSILFILAKNQRNIVYSMEKASAAYVVATDAPINRTVREAVVTLENSETLRSYSMAAAKICDGRGIERVISEVFQ
jgi:UDP-2,4-diacetamido-2,4,6-trideoxy-beta-L-altropyranose hydrolase